MEQDITLKVAGKPYRLSAARKLSAQKKMSRLVEEVEALQGDVAAYLDGMKKGK